MFAWFRRRYLDLLGSIYIYNEHRGYTSIDRILEAVRSRMPDDAAFIAAVEKHRADERKHYVMFKRWFELQGKMPLTVDRTCGHIDRFVEIMFRRRIDDLDTDEVICERPAVRAALPGDLADRAARDEAGRHPAEASAGQARQDADQDLPDDREGRAEPLGAL